MLKFKNLQYLYKIATFKLLMHNQVNLIKFTESSKLDDVYHKIWQIFFDQISLIKIGKIGRVLFNQINLMKKSQSKLKFPHVKKKCEDKTANE